MFAAHKLTEHAKPADLSWVSRFYFFRLRALSTEVETRHFMSKHGQVVRTEVGSRPVRGRRRPAASCEFALSIGAVGRHREFAAYQLSVCSVTLESGRAACANLQKKEETCTIVEGF